MQKRTHPKSKASNQARIHTQTRTHAAMIRCTATEKKHTTRFSDIPPSRPTTPNRQQGPDSNHPRKLDG